MPLAGLGGAVAALGHAPLSLPLLAILGLTAIVLALARAPGRAAGFWTAWVAGAAYFAVLMHWIVEPFLVDAALTGWMAPFALVLLAGGLALFWGIAGWAAIRLRPSRPELAFVLALALAEVGRSVLFTGLPWGLIGGIWINGPAASWLSWVGPHGLSLLTLLIAAMAVTTLAHRPLLALLPLLGGPLALSLMGLLQPAALLPAPDAPTVRLIQPNAPQHLKWHPDWTGVFYRRQLEMTAAPGAPALTVWPETAIAARLPRDARVLGTISDAADGRSVLLGLNRDEGWELRNAALAIGPGGEITQLYDKTRLVPFGEYIPFSDLVADWGIGGLAAQSVAGFSPGSGAALMDLGALGRALPLICYEAIFPPFGRRLSLEADFMLHLTNDAWFGTFAGPQQHLDLARMRARERGLPVVRAANTGITAMIDARGGVVESLALGQEGYIDVALPPRAAPTFYANWGEVPFVALWLLTSLGAFARRHFQAN